MGAHTWSAKAYQTHGAFVPALGAPVLDLLAPKVGEAILDLGCGDGDLTQQIAARGAHVVGIDGSADMVAAARARGLDAHVMDAQDLDFDDAFDAVFTNAALHWMVDAPAVARGVLRALKPGGRYVGEFGGFGNVAAIRGACRAARRMLLDDPDGQQDKAEPWYFPTDVAFKALMNDAGFIVDDLALFARPTPLPTGLVGWLETFAQTYAADLSAGQRDMLYRRASEILAPILCDDQGGWVADYVRLRFVARKLA